MGPAPCVLDRGLAPDAGRPVEVQEQVAPEPGRLLDREVAIDAEGLGHRQQGELAVQVTPARLDDRHPRVGEVRDGFSEKIGFRYCVGVEDRHELSARLLEPGREGTGLEPGALATVEVGDREPARAELARGLGDDRAGVVGGVVENLDLEAVARVVEGADSLEQPARDVALIVEGKLHGHGWPLGWRIGSHRFPDAPAVPPVDRKQEIGVQAVEKERDDRDEVEDSDDDAHIVLVAKEAATGRASARQPEWRRSA